MSQFENVNRGALFKNKDKKSDSHPDYKGTVGDQNGVEYWASAWIKEPRAGGDLYLSIALTPKDDNTEQRKSVNRSAGADDFLSANKAKIDAHRPRNASEPRPATPPSTDFDSFDDDIPF